MHGSCSQCWIWPGLCFGDSLLHISFMGRLAMGKLLLCLSFSCFNSFLCQPFPSLCSFSREETISYAVFEMNVVGLFIQCNRKCTFHWRHAQSYNPFSLHYKGLKPFPSAVGLLLVKGHVPAMLLYTSPCCILEPAPWATAATRFSHLCAGWHYG